MNTLFKKNILFSEENIEKNKSFSNIKEYTKQTCERIINIDITDNITLEQAQEILNWIIEENKDHKHMIEKTVEQIQDEINWWLWYVAMINWKLAWCITMIEITTKSWIKIYEVWSLITVESMRWLWIAKKLTKEIFEKNKEKTLYSITEVKWVMHIYQDILWLNNLNRNELNNEILEKIEEVWELLETDRIYWNDNFIINNI